MGSFGASGIDLGTSGVDFCALFGTKTPPTSKKNAEGTPYDPTIQEPPKINSPPTQPPNNPAVKRFLMAHDPARRNARSDPPSFGRRAG